MYFNKLKLDEKALIFKGLKRLVEEGDQGIFHNGDPGHPVYSAGAVGKSITSLGYADLPPDNATFLMLRELTLDLKDGYSDTVWWHDFSTWRNFCKYAVDMYKKHKRK